MGITIRSSTVQDVETILEIINYEIIHSTAIYDYTARSYEDQLQWYKDKEERQFPVIVAEYGGKVIGFGAYGSFRQKIAYRFSVEHSVYVHHQYQGMGAGRMLLEELIRLAKEQGFHTMIAGIDAANEGSCEFHRKLGFVETARMKEVGYKFNRWLDLVFMQLILHENQRTS